MTDSGKDERVVFLYLTHGKGWDPSRKRSIQCFDEFIGDDGECGIGRMNAIQRENAAKQIRRKPLPPYHDTLGIDGIVESLRRRQEQHRAQPPDSQ